MEYTIVSGTFVEYLSTEEFSEKVNKAISDGYVPIGGISVSTHRGALILMQAMIKKET